MKDIRNQDQSESSESSDELEGEHFDTEILYKQLNKNLNKKNPDEEGNGYDKSIYKYKLSVIHHIKFKNWWEILIILTACYSVAFIPIRLALSTTMLDPFYEPMDLITWIIYVLDLVVNMRTTFLDRFGYEVTNGRKIALKYLMSFTFFLDLVSLFALPTYFVSGFLSTNAQNFMSLFGILKMARLFRIKGLIVQSRQTKLVKMNNLTFYYLGFLFVYLHICGCIFFFFMHETYKYSSDRLAMYDALKIRSIPDGANDYVYNIWEHQRDELKFVEDVHAKLAKPYWYPAFDNFDGSERIWESFEISKMTSEELAILNITPKRNEFLYLWTISIYYSVLILGGNEM